MTVQPEDSACQMMSKLSVQFSIKTYQLSMALSVISGMADQYKGPQVWVQVGSAPESLHLSKAG